MMPLSTPSKSSHRTSSSYRGVLASALFVIAGLTVFSAHAQVVDPDLSAKIDALEDVVKRLDFDQQRIGGVDYVYNLQDYNLLLCGDVIAALQYDLKGGLALKLGGGVSVDASLLEKLELKFESDNKLSGKIGVTSNGQTIVIACWDMAPWLTAALYRDRLEEAPPMEGFTYDEYEGSGEPGPTMRTASGDAFDGDSGLDSLTPEARTFLNSALTAVIGSGVPASFTDTPLYQDVVAPVNDLADALDVAGKLGFDAASSTFSPDNFENAYSIASNATFANGDFATMISSLTGAVGDLLPQASMLNDIGDGFENLTLSDLDPCAIESSSLFDSLSLPPAIATGVDTVCDGASEASMVLTTGTLNAFNDAVDTLENVAVDVDSTFQTVQTISGHLSTIEEWSNYIINRLGYVRNYLTVIFDKLQELKDTWPTL